MIPRSKGLPDKNCIPDMKAISLWISSNKDFNVTKLGPQVESFFPKGDAPHMYDRIFHSQIFLQEVI